tara:strand:+ start:420 stop:668 length:249 start_codon:yes stop_codon:yes gene_type:complete
MSSTPSDMTTNNNTVSEKIGYALLVNCAKNGNDDNSKLAKKTLDNAKEIGVTAAYEQLAKDCFKHPENGTKLSYAEMRMRYG